MKYTVRISSGSCNEYSNTENSSAEIKFSISISHESATLLQEAFEKIKKENTDIFTDDFTKLLSEPKSMFKTVQHLTELETAVTALISELGIPAHTKGYRYLRDAIVLTTENPSLIGQVTKALYPTIAKSYDTTPVRVERVMRHAIEYCCLKGNQEAVNAHFSHCLASQRGKPTNSEFIAILSDKLKMYI